MERLKSAIEIDEMSQEDALQYYIDLQRKKDGIEMTMQFIKQKFERELQEKGLDKFDTDIGGVSLVKQNRNQFQQKKAKEFLTEDQLKECYEEKEVTFVKVMSAEAKEAAKKFMEKKKREE
ncbi:MAG: hypothetical protein ACOC22_00680 [bacterium]